MFQGGEQKVSYGLQGPLSSTLEIDGHGTIRVVGDLDREALERGVASVPIVAVDSGVPPLSSTGV